VGWAAAIVLAAAGGFAGVRSLPHRPPPPAEPLLANDQELVQDLRILENLHQYEHAENLVFLQDLDHLGLFGDDR
jgi:hypothetical protein